MIPRFSVILFSLITVSLFGQKQDFHRFQLGAEDLRKDTATSKTLITSASRSIKFLEDLPVTVYVIKREEILENGYNTLVDVLKDVPGIKVSQPGSGMEGETFLMNGLYGNYYCKILINGMPIAPSVVSGMPISGNLPVRQAERIEIISGPAAALYGSDALAGVVNIIIKESDRPVWTQADLSVGSQGSYNMNVMLGGKFGKNKNVAEYSLYGNYGQQSDMKIKYDNGGNYDPGLYNPDAINEPHYRGTSTSPEFDRLPMSSSLLGFGLKYRGIKANYDHLDRKNHSSIGLNTGSHAFYDPSSYWGETIDRIGISYSNTWGKFSSSTQASLLIYRMDNNSSFHLISDRGDQGVIYKYAASDDILLDEVLTYAVNKNLEVNAGFSLQFSSNLPVTNDLNTQFDRKLYKPFDEEINMTDTLLGTFGLNPRNFYNIAGFLQMYYKLGKMTMLAGARWDEHSIFGSNISPKIGLQYKFTDALSVRVNYGNGYRAPSLHYVYSSIAYPVDSNGTQYIVYENLPNPQVKPEKFRAFEIGLRYNPRKKLEVEFVFFYNKLVENITFSAVLVDPEKYPDAANLIALSAANDKDSKAELFSGQLNIRARDVVPAIKLNSDLFLTYTKGNEVLPNGFGQLDDYRNMPNWMVQWKLDVQPMRKWVVILRNTLSDSWKKRFFPFPLEIMENSGFPIETGGYYTMDLTNRFKINRNFHAFLIINNVFNAEYGGIDAYGGIYDLQYNPQYGRNFRLGFSFTME